MPLATTVLVALHGTLGYAIAAAFDLDLFLKIGLPLLFLAGNMLIAPFVMERAYRIDWTPRGKVLEDDVCKFLLELFQMHGKVIPGEFASLLGAQASLPIPIGIVYEEAPAIMVVRSPMGGTPGLVVSTGFTRQLDLDAQKAAVAHEIYYLLKGDVPGSTALLALPSLLLALSRTIDSDPKGGFIAKNIGIILYGAYRASLALTAWIHRRRLLHADAFAAEMTGNPNAMASAIMVLSYGLARAAESPEGVSPAAASPLNLAGADAAARLGAEAELLGDFSPAGMVAALRWEKLNLAGRFFEFFEVHPLTSRRIDQLATLAGKAGHEFAYPLDSIEGSYRFGALFWEGFSRAAPWLGAWAGYTAHLYYGWPSDLVPWSFAGFIGGVAVYSAMWYPPLSGFRPATSRQLVLDLDATEAAPIPVRLEGTILGRQRPGYAFGSDLVLQDRHGQIVIGYRQPVSLLDAAFGYLAADDLKGRRARVDGWFRRNPGPYVEARRIVMLDDGRTYGCYRWLLQWAGVALLIWLWTVVRSMF